MAYLTHYAESFCVTSGRCFRMIQAIDGTGHAQHCPYLTVWRGRFQDATGKWWTVEACDGHRGDLDSVQRITAIPHRMPQEGPQSSVLELGPSH